MQKNLCISLSLSLFVAQVMASDSDNVDFMQQIACFAVPQRPQLVFQDMTAHDSYTGHMAIEQYKENYPQVYVQNPFTINHSANETKNFISTLYNHVCQANELDQILASLPEDKGVKAKADVMHAVVPQVSLLRCTHGPAESPITLAQLAALLAYESDIINTAYRERYKKFQDEEQPKQIYTGAFLGLGAGAVLSYLITERGTLIAPAAISGMAIGSVIMKAIQNHDEPKQEKQKKRIETLTQRYLRNARIFAQHKVNFYNGHLSDQMPTILEKINLQNMNTYQVALATPIVDVKNQPQGLAIVAPVKEEPFDWDAFTEKADERIRSGESSSQEAQDDSNKNIFHKLQLEQGNHSLFIWMIQEEGSDNMRLVHPEFTPCGHNMNPEFEKSKLYRVYADQPMEIPADNIHNGTITYKTVEDGVRGLANLPTAPFVRVPLENTEDRFALILNPVKMHSETEEDMMERIEDAKKIEKAWNRQTPFMNSTIPHTTVSVGQGCNSQEFVFPNTNETSGNSAEWQKIDKEPYLDNTDGFNYYRKIINGPIASYYQQEKAGHDIKG